MPVTVICETCGKVFTVAPSVLKYDPPRFCSPACFYKWLKGSTRTEYADVQCETCGKPMHIRAYRLREGRGRFCSQTCMIAARPDPPRTVAKIALTCLLCGKGFTRYPSQIKRPDQGRFCSATCRVQYTNRRIALMRPSSIEALLITELDRREIEYLVQYPLCGFVLDFAFPNHKLAVEADGVYWHNLENVKEKDARKDRALSDCGWTILHFGEWEIQESPTRCIDQIVQHFI